MAKFLRAWMPGPFRSVCLGMIAAFAVAVALAGDAPKAPAQATSPPTPTPPTTISPEVVEEWKLRASEEVARLEALVKMRKVEARMADAELEVAQARQNYTENMLTKGLTSKATLKNNQVARLESEMHVVSREALLKEAEGHLAQAKRRVARLERGQANPLLDSEAPGAGILIRVQELETLLARISQNGESIERRVQDIERGK